MSARRSRSGERLAPVDRAAVHRAPAKPWQGSPLATWFAAPASIERFRRHTLGRVAAVLTPRDRTWRTIAPTFDAVLDLAHEGVPFQIVASRRYDRSGRPGALPRALRDGHTIFFPQIHQVLPRLARLMVALRRDVVGPAREEFSYLFLVEGQGREGMGLHHDGEVNAFWLQLEGRRTVTLGPPVPRRTPLDLPDTVAAVASRAPSHSFGKDLAGWRTIDLTPGTLFHMPPRTPHRVVCHGRSLAVSLTWTCARPRGRRGAAATAWAVVDGRVDVIPRPARDRLWVQVPVAAGAIDRREQTFGLTTADGDAVTLPAHVQAWAMSLAPMPSLGRRSVPPAALAPLLEHGILAPMDLPRVVRPTRPRALDGWLFA